jgi:deoxyribonuclease-4
MNLGAHMSIEGGLPNALVRGREAGCSVVQIFLKNQRQWAGRAVPAEEVAEFKRLREVTGIAAVFAHATYLINLCSPVEAEWTRAVEAFADELERAELLGLPFVVIHPGSHKGAGVRRGLARLVRAIDALHARTAGYGVKIALENAAGCGNLLGGRAEELGAVIMRVREPERLAFCLDTCHLFAAGYDIRTAAGLRATLARFDAAVGLERVVAWHLNDAKAGLGSGLDRHEHIGRGAIGRAAFGRLLRHPAAGRRPMVLETPKEGDWDRKNLRVLRRLRRPAATSRPSR